MIRLQRHLLYGRQALGQGGDGIQVRRIVVDARHERATQEDACADGIQPFEIGEDARVVRACKRHMPSGVGGLEVVEEKVD